MSQLNYIAEQVSYFGYDINNFPAEIFPDELVTVQQFTRTIERTQQILEEL